MCVCALRVCWAQSSCHQCKSRRNEVALTYCTSLLDKKNKRCRKKVSADSSRAVDRLSTAQRRQPPQHTRRTALGASHPHAVRSLAAVCAVSVARRRQFCGHCLKKFYKENPNAIPDKSSWKCPVRTALHCTRARLLHKRMAPLLLTCMRVCVCVCVGVCVCAVLGCALAAATVDCFQSCRKSATATLNRAPAQRRRTEAIASVDADCSPERALAVPCRAVLCCAALRCAALCVAV